MTKDGYLPESGDMTASAVIVSSGAGRRFQDGADHGRVIVFGHDTGGKYSLMEYVVAAGEGTAPHVPRSYGAHRHRECEETFLIRRGELEFLLGDEVVTLRAGDFLRVPPGIRHGYANVSGAEVEMLVGFMPGGLEELFVKYRTDGSGDGEGFVAEATRLHASEFGLD